MSDVTLSEQKEKKLEDIQKEAEEKACPVQRVLYYIKGKKTGKFITETLAGALDNFSLHLTGSCPQRECIRLVEYVVNRELCIRCGKCLEVCRYDAIVGEIKKPYRSGYLPFEIRQKRCTRCGECITACPTGAIEVITREVEEETVVP